jgi:3D (Asp-Asp-Asp) domain-containing protein
MWVTAYSSTPEETDDTPFITASGTRVRDGIVATNELPMGTKIKIPAAYGDKIFTVEDRMHARMKNKIDIWMPEKHLARKFGITRTEIVVLAD